MDTLTAFFSYWDVSKVCQMLGAMSRFLEQRGPLLNDELLLLEQVVPLGPLYEGDGFTDNWVDAMGRLGALYPDGVRPEVEEWARAVWLGVIALSLSAQELMFTEEENVRLIRGTRCPTKEKLQVFRPFLTKELDAFRKRGFSHPDYFVAQCRAFYCYGVEDSTFLPIPIPRTTHEEEEEDANSMELEE